MRRILAGAVAIIVAATLLTQPAQAAIPLTFLDIYNPAKIVRVDFTLPTSSVTSLNTQSTLETYVPGAVSFSSGTKVSGSIDIEVRLKGSTSLQKLDWTPSFKIKFKKGANGLGYLGLRRMTLNAMTQDTSKLHEFGAYALFNAAGVVASKTGWARVYVNGIDKGLYLNVETTDETFMSRRFRDITQHVYEGAGADLWWGSDYGNSKQGPYLTDYGWKITSNKYDLNNLVAFANVPDQATWWNGLNTVTDRTSLIKFFAVENFIGHWDGYSGPDKNNYFIRSNTQNKFTFLPWGTDQTFGENLATTAYGDSFYMPMLSEKADQPWEKNLDRGMLYVKCINYKPCKTQYLLALKAVSAKATSLGLVSKLRSAAKVIEPVLQARYGTNLETLKVLNGIHIEQERNISFISTRQSQVAELLRANGVK